MNILEKIDQVLTGTKPTPKDPTENSARIICEYALAEIKKLDGLKEYLDGETKCVALMHDVNFVLTEETPTNFIRPNLRPTLNTPAPASH